jgi:hypothetical protein
MSLQEYAMGGHISTKLDAFAFGICLVEMLTDLKPSRARELVDAHEEEGLVDKLMKMASLATFASQGDEETKKGTCVGLLTRDVARVAT